MASLATNPDLNSALGGSGPPAAATANIDDLIQKQQGRSEELTKRTDEAISSIEKGREKTDAAGFDFQKAVERTEKSINQPAPVEHDRSPMEAFGSAASMIAVFGSLLTRRPMVNAMNAAAGVMNAWKAQDRVAFDREMDTYKTNMENARALYTLQHDTYKSILDAQDKDDKTKLAELSAYAAAFKDSTMPDLLAAKNLTAVQKHQEFMEAQSLKLQQAANNLGFREQGLSLQEQRLELLRDKFEADQGKNKVDVNDPEEKSYVKAIADYDARLPTAGRNPELRKNLIAEVKKVNPEYREGEYDQVVKGMRDFGTGKQGDIARSLNVSVSHLELLRDLGRALNNGNVTLVNAAKQRWQEEFGSPAPTNFDTAKSIIADEVAKGVIGGQSAQSDRETLASSLKRERSFPAIEGAINTFQSLLGGQLGGLRDQWARTTKAPKERFDKEFLNDLTIKALEKDKKPSASEKTGVGAKSGGFVIEEVHD